MIHTCKFCDFNSPRKHNLKVHYRNVYSCSQRTEQETLDLIEELTYPTKCIIKIKELHFAIGLANNEIEKLQQQIEDLRLK